MKNQNSNQELLFLNKYDKSVFLGILKRNDKAFLVFVKEVSQTINLEDHKLF